MRSAGAQELAQRSARYRFGGGAGRGAGAGAGARQSGRACGPGDDRRRGERAGPPAAAETFSRAELEKLLAPIALYPDPLLAQTPARQRLPGADRPGAALARQEPGRGREQRLFRDRQSELGSGGEGARALSRRDQDDERGSRLDDGSRRRRSEPAPGRRRRDPGASRQGATERRSQDDRATDGHDHPATGHGRERRGALKRLTSKSSRPIPATVYVPSYDPVAVYEPYSGVAPLLGFGAGIAVGALWNNNSWNWGSGAIYPPVWAGYSGLARQHQQRQRQYRK